MASLTAIQHELRSLLCVLNVNYSSSNLGRFSWMSKSISTS